MTLSDDNQSHTPDFSDRPLKAIRGSSRRSTRFLIVLAAVTLVGLLLRGVVCMQLADSPEVSRPNPQSDMATYLRLGAEIRHGNLPDHYDYQPLYYTVFLPLLIPDNGSKLWLLMFQAIVGAAAVYLAGLCTAIVFSRRFAWFAALLLALARFHIFYTPFALYEVLQSFWITLLCFWALRAWRHNLIRDWMLAAITLAFAILARGNALLFLPILLAAVVIRNWHSNRRKGVVIAAVIVLIAYLPQLPFAIRNYHYTGRWVGASTAAGKVLILGNSPEAPAAGLAYPRTYSIWTAQHDNGERSAMESILDWAIRNPLPFLELKFRTLLHFWDAEEIPNNVNIEAHGYPFSGLLSMPFLLEFALFAPLGLAGLLLSFGRKTSGRQRMVAAFVVIFMAATVAFYMLARFRIAIIPLLCVLAAGTVTRLMQLKHLTKRQRAAAVIALVFSAITVNGALFLYRYGYESTVIAAISPDGVRVFSPDGAVLIHDHGPLPMGVGGITPCVPEPPPAPLTIEKRFAIPENQRKDIEVRPFQARLLILNPKGLPLENVIVTHGTQTSPVHLETHYAFSTFLCADFSSADISPDGTAAFTFLIPPNVAPHIAIDVLRDFGRTCIACNGQPVSAGGEVFAELDFPAPKP